MVSTAYACSKMYKLQYIDKAESDEKGSSALEFGTCIHMGLQASLEGEPGLDSFRAYWDSIKDKDLTYYYPFDWEKLYDLGELFLTRFDKLHAKHLQIVHPMEVRLFGKLPEGYLIEGTPDFIGKYKGVDSIVDFKTSKDLYTADKLIVDEQMYIYNYLARTQLGFQPVQHVYIVFGKKDERIQVLIHQPSDEELGKAIDNVERMCKELEQREKDNNFPMNKKSCLIGTYRCKYWSNCHGSKTDK